MSRSREPAYTLTWVDETLLPYLPRLAAEWDLDAPGASWRSLDATCCFVDISGFTALSERLARRGRIGAEELTEVLNHVFSRMLGVAYEKGGSLLKFGGDALLLAFDADDHAVLAAQAAVAMRAALREARSFPTSVGRLNLRMSVGLHSGAFDFFRVGATHHELLVAGPAATSTTRMEQTADAGEIVISAATADRLPAGAVGAEKGDGRLLRWRAVVPGGPGARGVRQANSAEIAAGVPVALREHLREGGGESEHRVASVGFVKFQGVDDYLATYGSDATADALSAIVTCVQHAVDDEQVTFLASDIDANGGKIILVSGVPIAQDDDEGRMLRTARAIVDQEFALPVRIGVNRGHVFAGEIGTEFRRTFTVMGDTVNLAARLMAAATPGRLYATAEILERSRTLFATEALEPFHVKGKTHPVQAYAVGAVEGARGAELSSLPFVGRDDELERLEKAYRVISAGAGSVRVIEGDRGSGKSRLLHELVQRCDAPVFKLQGEAFATAIPYMPWRAPLRELLHLDSGDPAQGGRLLADALKAMAPDLLPLAPLLNPVLDVELPPTAESSAIAPDFRRERLADLIVELLGAEPVSRLVIVDDAQWLDGASASILERVVAAARGFPWMIVVARRPDSSGSRPAAGADMKLDPIDTSTFRDLVDAVTIGAPLRPQERDQLVRRAAGNPLFLEELLRVARTTGFDALPETLDAVATREIDALSHAARRVVRCAGVLGQVFDRELLVELLGDDVLDDETLAQLALLLVPSEGRLKFRHALLQEAAYESLPFRKRVELHRQAGEAILRLAANDGETADALLSMHFFRAQDWERTWTYARVAGRHAAAAYAPAEAATHLDRAITAARRLGDVPSEEIAQLLVELGEALVTLGVFDKADDAYRRAAAAMRHDPIEHARVLERRSYVRGECQGRLTAAIRDIRAGIALLGAVEGSDVVADRVRAQLLAREADFRFKQGRLREAAKLCGEAMVNAERVGDRRALAVAMGVLDSCLVELGRPEEATHMAQVLELYEELGDQLYVAITLGNLGGVSFFESKWVQAADYFMRAAEAGTKAGDLAIAAIAHTNLGEVRVNQGRLEEAETLLVSAVRTLESFEYLIAAAQARLQLARTRAFLGDYDTGLAMLQAATSTLDDASVLVGSVEARARLVEVSAFAGDADRAARALAEARELERELGGTPLAALLDRVEVTLTATAGDPTSTAARLEHAVARARDDGAKYDLLLLLELADRMGLEADAREREELASELGVVRFVALPAQLARAAERPRSLTT